MSVLSILKKIGAVIVWPVTHAAMLVEFLADATKDYPATRTVLAGLVSEFEAIGPDAIAALAADGLNVSDDIKAGVDLAALFTYFKDKVVPVIEEDYADFKSVAGTSSQTAIQFPPPAAVPADPTSPTVPVSAAAASAAPAIVQGPGLHNVVKV